MASHTVDWKWDGIGRGQFQPINMTINRGKTGGGRGGIAEQCRAGDCGRAPAEAEREQAEHHQVVRLRSERGDQRSENQQALTQQDRRDPAYPIGQHSEDRRQTEHPCDVQAERQADH